MRETTEHEDVLFDYQQMVDAFDAYPACQLVALNTWEIPLLLSVLRYAHWQSRWVNLGEAPFKEVAERITRLEECLMSGCDVSALIGVIESGFEQLGITIAGAASQGGFVQPGCTSGGTSLDAPNGIQGGTPPPGYTYPDPTTPNRKCKASNMIIDSVIAVIEKLRVFDADDYANMGFVLACGLVGAILGSYVPIAGTLIGAIAGTIVSAVVLLITEGAALDLEDLGILLAANRDDFVCSLYIATTAAGARAAVVNLLGALGASWAECKLVGLCLPNKLVNLLFYTIEIYEDTLKDWPSATDCSLCPSEPGYPTIIIIPESPYGFIEWDGTLCTITAEWDGASLYRANFQCCMSDNYPDLRCANIANWQSNETYHEGIDNWIHRCDDTTGYLPKPFEQADIQHFKQLALASFDPYVVSFNFLGQWIP